MTDSIVRPTIFEILEQRLFLLLGAEGACRFQGRGADAILKSLQVSCVGQAWLDPSRAPQEMEDLPRLEPENAALHDPLRGVQAAGVDEDVLAAYLTLRVVLLAESVFSDQALARSWLCQKKLRLRGHTPLDLAGFPPCAALLEHWLAEIDEGMGL